MFPEKKYVVMKYVDYIYPYNRVPDMIEILQTTPEVEIVWGNRFNGKVNPKASKSLFHFGNKLITFPQNNLNSIHLKGPITGLCVIYSENIINWRLKSKNFDIKIELNLHVKRIGFVVIEVPIDYKPQLGEMKHKITQAIVIFCS